MENNCIKIPDIIVTPIPTVIKPEVITKCEDPYASKIILLLAIGG